MATKWKKGNRADIIAALSKSLKHLPKFSPKTLEKELGVEFEYKVGTVGIGGPHWGPKYKPEGIPSHGCVLRWKPTGIGGNHCSPTLIDKPRKELFVGLRSLVKKKSK